MYRCKVPGCQKCTFNLEAFENEYAGTIKRRERGFPEAAKWAQQIEADFGLRSEVTMPEVGFVTQCIQDWDTKKFMPDVGLVGAIVKGDLATSEEATSSYTGPGAALLHERMQRQAHLELRQVRWQHDAWVRAKEYVTNARTWYDQSPEWLPAYIRDVDLDPTTLPYGWPKYDWSTFVYVPPPAADEEELWVMAVCDGWV